MDQQLFNRSIPHQIFAQPRALGQSEVLHHARPAQVGVHQQSRLIEVRCETDSKIDRREGLALPPTRTGDAERAPIVLAQFLRDLRGKDLIRVGQKRRVVPADDTVRSERLLRDIYIARARINDVAGGDRHHLELGLADMPGIRASDRLFVERFVDPRHPVLVFSQEAHSALAQPEGEVSGADGIVRSVALHADSATAAASRTRVEVTPSARSWRGRCSASIYGISPSSGTLETAANPALP